MNEADRRDFLRGAGSAVLSVAFSRGARGANDCIALGFVGVGVMGSANLQAAVAQAGVAVAA